MPAPAWEDLDEFLDLDDFAVPAVIHLQGGGTVSLSVIYDSPYIEAELRDAYTKDDAMPRVMCKASLVHAVRRGDTITVTFPGGARTFDIKTAPQSTGTGLAEIAMSWP